MMNYIFLGGKEIGNYVLRNLLTDGLMPVGIISYQDIIADDLLVLAKTKGIQILQLDKFKGSAPAIVAFVKEMKAEMLVSVAFPYILPGEVLRSVTYPVNVHTADIPKYRGFHPLSAAFLNDEPKQGTTVHLMTEEVDAGKIILQDFVPVSNEDDMVTVRAALIDLSYRLLKQALHQIDTNTAILKEQTGEVLGAPKRTPADSKIDFNRPSRYLHNFIRALVDPYPNAFGYKEDGSVVKIKRSIASNKAGVVLDKTQSGKYVVSTADGVVLLELDSDLKPGDIIK